MLNSRIIAKHSLLLAFTASIVASSSAFAATENADLVAERIKEIYAEQGVNIEFKTITTSGNDIVLGDTTLQVDTIAENPFNAGDIELKSVSSSDDGIFTIGQVIVPDLKFENAEDKSIVEVNGLRMENVTLPAKDAKNVLDKMLFYEKISLDQMNISIDGITRSSLNELATTINTTDRQQKIDFTMDIGNLYISTEGDAPEDNPLAAINMTELNISLQSNGVWEPEKGNVNIQNMKFNAQDLGQLNIISEVSGYNLEFVEALQKVQQNMSEAGVDMEASAMTILGLSEQLNINSMEIRFDDNSLTEKLIAHFAKEQGTDAAGFTQQLKLMAPLLAMQLQNPDFANQVKEASDKFFDNPKSLTLSAKPEQPVSVAAIAATAALDPTKILLLLNIGLSAND